MKDLRRNEFIDMLEMAELLYEATDKFIKCYIPTLGKVTYYPKSDKINVHVGNKWFEDGFYRVKNILSNTTKTENIIQTDQAYIDKVTSIIKKEEKSDAELRNEFAGLALSGIMASGLAQPIQQHQFDNIAEDAFRLADAMVKFSKL